MEKIIDIYKMTNEREKELWEKAIFIFDSSSLLDFYFLPKKTREKIYSEIFEKMPNRLWIPAHVKYEYLKNKEKIIKKPIAEKFIPLEKEVKEINRKVTEVNKYIDSIINKTKKDDKHPHIIQDKISLFKTEIEEFIKKTEQFETDFLEQINSAKTEVLSVEDNDDVFNSVNKYFEVGEDFNFNKILDITHEGKHRYEFKIPPGYGDLNKGDKKGTQIFADLIIWKQIIEYSIEKQFPIIFITNDISKDDDWCYIDKNKKVISPREELIKEINDASNVEFWIYSQPEFLYNSNKYLKSTIEEESIKNASNMLNSRNINHEYLTYKCSKCKKINKAYKDAFELDFEYVGSDDREMGHENEYTAIEYFNCECGNEIEATFGIWEYPVGTHNYDSIELYGADLIDPFYITIDFFNEEREEVECDICGVECDIDNMVHMEGVGYICPHHEMNTQNKHYND